jgi:excisionase family DNA binding protein
LAVKITKLTPLRPTTGLLTLPQAAEYLNISAGTLRNWVSERRLAYVKVGSKTHFRLAVLEAYIEAHTVPAVPAAAER